MGTTERREREKQKRRMDILNAARELFVSKGLRATTIDDIARSTELARGTIYLYFDTKEEIYATLLQEGMDILQSMIEAAYDPADDPLANLLNGHDAYLDFHDRYPQYHSIMIVDKLDISEMISAETRQELDTRMEKMGATVAALLDEGVRQGMFRAMDTQQVAYMQMGMATGFAIMLDNCRRCGMAFGGPNRSQVREVIHDLVANGVMRRSA